MLTERLREAWRISCANPRLRYVSIRTVAPLQLGKGFDIYLRKNLRKRLKAYRRIAASYLHSYPTDLPGSRIDKLRWRYAVLAPQRFLNLLRRSEGVITGRFHLVTLCLVTGTPFYAIPSNTHKIEALLRQVGLSDRLRSSYEDAVVDADTVAFSEMERGRIERFLQEVRLQAQEMFMTMAQLARSRHEITDR